MEKDKQEMQEISSDAEALVHTLMNRRLTISTMESVTSGLIASMLTDTEGASAIFFGGEVTYSNEAKIAAGVPREVIERYGVYSPECARAMAEAVQQRFATELAIGITGTAGNPDPNNGDSEQGVAYFCIRRGGEAYGEKVVIATAGRSRREIKQTYADAVFAALRRMLEE